MTNRGVVLWELTYMWVLVHVAAVVAWYWSLNYVVTIYAGLTIYALVKVARVLIAERRTPRE